MSVKLDIWNGCKLLLADLKTDGTIKHYAIFNNQYDKEAKDILFEFPAVLLQLKSIIWDNAKLTDSTNKQKNGLIGTAIITLHIGFKKYVDETKSFEENDPIIDMILEKFHAVVIGQYTTALIKIEERTDDDHDNVTVHQVDFQLQVQETISKNTIESATLTLDLSGTIT